MSAPTGNFEQVYDDVSSLKASKRRNTKLPDSSVYIISAASLVVVCTVVFICVLKSPESGNSSGPALRDTRKPQAPPEAHLPDGFTEVDYGPDVFRSVFDLKDNTAYWHDGANNPLKHVATKPPVVISPNSGNGAPDLHLKKSFWGRKVFYVDAELPNAADEGSVWLLNEMYFNKGQTQFGKNAWPSAGEIDIFETLFEDASLDRSKVYPNMINQCAEQHKNWYFNPKVAIERTQLRYAVVVDNLRPTDEGFPGQFVQIIHNPPREMFENSTTLDVIKLLQSSAASTIRMKMVNNANTFWGSQNTPLGETCRTQRISGPDFDKTKGVVEKSCGWPFFSGFVWTAKCNGGSEMKIHSLKVFQPSDIHNRCLIIS